MIGGDGFWSLALSESELDECVGKGYIIQQDSATLV